MDAVAFFASHRRRLVIWSGRRRHEGGPKVPPIFALDAIADAGLTLRGDVQVQSVVEEEITGNGSATAFVRGFVADAVLSPEPTNEQLVRANVGVLKFRLMTQGRPAHPLDPAAGKSAIDLMIRLIAALKSLEQKWIDEKSSHRVFQGISKPNLTNHWNHFWRGLAC